MTQLSSPITLGSCLRTVRVPDFVLTDTIHQPNNSLSRHHHELVNFVFVLDGSFAEVLSGREIFCTPRSVLLKPAGEAHANRYGTRGARCFLIEIQPDKVASLGSCTKNLQEVRHLRGGVFSTLLARAYKEFRLMDEASTLAIEGLMLELMAEVCRQSRHSPETTSTLWLKDARDILHAQVHSSKTITLKNVASAVGRHPVHLAREFRRTYGCTLGEYVRRLRIELSRQKLASSDMSLAEIALASGFSSQSHFSTIFRRYSGMTPAEFRSLHRDLR